MKMFQYTCHISVSQSSTLSRRKQKKWGGGGREALKETKQTMNGKGTHISHCGPPWATSLKFPIVNTIQELQFYSK